MRHHQNRPQTNRISHRKWRYGFCYLSVWHLITHHTDLDLSFTSGVAVLVSQTSAITSLADLANRSLLISMHDPSAYMLLADRAAKQGVELAVGVNQVMISLQLHDVIVTLCR